MSVRRRRAPRPRRGIHTRTRRGVSFQAFLRDTYQHVTCEPARRRRDWYRDYARIQSHARHRARVAPWTARARRYTHVCVRTNRRVIAVVRLARNDFHAIDSCVGMDLFAPTTLHETAVTCWLVHVRYRQLSSSERARLASVGGPHEFVRVSLTAGSHRRPSYNLRIKECGRQRRRDYFFVGGPAVRA